jgi:hypothetical protein
MSRVGSWRLGVVLGVMCLAAGCIREPWVEVDVAVRVPREVQAMYSEAMRGLVVVRLEAGSFDDHQVFAVLCDPTSETLGLEGTMGGIGCVGPGAVTAWVEQPDVDEEPPHCDLEQSPYNGSNDEPPGGSAKGSEDVFAAANHSGCRSGYDAVELTVQLP